MSGTGFENYLCHKNLMREQAKKTKIAIVAGFSAGLLIGSAITGMVASSGVNQQQEPGPTEAIVQEEFER